MQKNTYIAGFTLIEMMIVVVILGIIAAIAIPSYQSYVYKGRRADGINTILSYSLAEERYRSTNSTYGSLAQIGGGTASPQGYYTMSISGTSATAYTITATATSAQASDAEGATSCTPLVLTASSGTITKTPAACWPS